MILRAATPLVVHFATHHPADGRALRYHFDEFMLECVQAVVSKLAERPAWRVASEYLGPDAVRMYMEQTLGLELHAVGQSVFRARFAASQGQAAWATPAPATLARILEESVGGGAVAIVPSARLDWRRRYFDVRKAARQLLLRRTAAPPQKLAGGFAIAVELVEGADLVGKCDAFWLASGSIDPSRVLFVLEGANRTLLQVEPSVEAVRRIGARAVAVDAAMARAGIPYWRPAALPKWVDELIGELPRPTESVDRWVVAAIRAMARRVAYWQAFFEEHGVQVVQQFTEFSLETISKRIAIDRVGGVELGKQRSQFFEKASAAFYFRHEVAFVWHRNATQFLRDGRTGTRFALETGYVYDYLVSRLKPQGGALRKRLHCGVATVAVLFDSYTHRNTHFSAEHLKKFYGVALSLAQEQPSLGLIVKSKKPEILAGLPDIASKIRALTEAGRCVVIDEPLVSVLPAALASDIALGFPASTAACEAAIAGCRVLMYDPSRAGRHPWAGDAGIMFSDADAFHAACASALSSGAGTPAARLREIDPYLDGKAAHRAAEFIGAFLSARESGLDKSASLSCALERCESYAVPL